MGATDEGENPFKRAKRGSRIVVSAKEERTMDGIVFDSKWEMRVYKYLKDNFGKRAFTLQPAFLLQEGFTSVEGEKCRPIQYKGDFIFGPKRKSADSPLTAKHVVIDAKGMKDPIFKMKRKMFLYHYEQPLYLPSRVRDLEPLKKIIIQKTGRKSLI